MRRAWSLGLLAVAACGGGPPPESEEPKISPLSVPSLDLLGSTQRGDASGSGDGPSCRDVINEERRRAERGEVGGEEPPPENRDEIKELLNSGQFIGACNVPETSRVEICAAIIDGVAKGVTVTIDPGSEEQASCVANAIRRMAFPEHPLVDVARSAFEPI
jgi:hypothetical protein